MRLSVFIANLVLAVGLCSCSNWLDRSSNKHENSLKLAISLDQPTHHLGESVIAYISLTNVGEEALLINSRMSLHAPSMTSPIRELAFNVTTPAGDSYVPPKTFNPMYFDLKYFIYLKPNEVYKIAFHFASNHYEFLEIGEYKIFANYQNYVDPNYVDPADNRVAWKGELNSNEVLLTIVP